MREGVSRCSQGSGRVVTGSEAHLLWSILINFGFLSFCGIKVLLLLLLLRLAPVFVWGQRGWEVKGMGMKAPVAHGAPGSVNWECGGASLKLDGEGYASELREIIS